MSPRVRVRGTLPVEVPPDVAWERFSDVASWRTWDWMGMADAAWLAGEPWQRGSALRVGHRPFTFDCRVAFCDPPFEVIWHGAGAGIDARHTYRVTDADYGVVDFKPSGIVAAEGRELDPRRWTMLGDRRRLPN